MITTNVPKPAFGPAGFIPPTDAAILAGVMADYNAAFGGNLDPGLSTPQGQLASSTAAIISQAYSQFINQANQIDPAFATGRMQDAIARLYFLQRNPALPTVVQATCAGLSGVPIPTGALAQAADGNIYTCTQGGTIGLGGSVVLPFSCNVLGAIPCPKFSLNFIYQAITGWNTISNLADGVLGNDVESRAAFEARRAASVALNSTGSLGSVLGAVLNVPGVLDAYVTENPSASPVVIGGFTVAARSIYVAAIGGLASAIAMAIWTKKAPGCGYNGNTTVTVVDPNPRYTPPAPSYAVTFMIPPALPILFAVNIANNPLVPANAAVLIQNAIISAFAGADGGPRARIGSTIFASRFYSALAALGSWVQIISLSLGSNNTNSAVFTGSIAGTALTVTSVTSGTIAIGQTILDATGVILPGTTITAGSGLSWTVSSSQTVASETITAAMPNQTKVGVNINQVPTVAAANIAVTIT